MCSASLWWKCYADVEVKVRSLFWLLLFPLCVRGDTTQTATADSLSLIDWTGWRVSQVATIGLRHTKADVILRELELREGAVYSDSLLAEDANHVKNTELFARMVVSVSPDSARREVKISYAVSERPRYMVYPVLDFGDNLSTSYGAGMLHVNLGGMGRQLFLEAVAGDVASYSLIYADPWFGGRPDPTYFELQRKEQDSSDDSYSYLTHMVKVEREHRITRTRNTRMVAYWRDVRITDSDPSERRTVNPSGMDVYAGGSFALICNTTDYYSDPHRGEKCEFGVGGFGGGGAHHPEGYLADISLAAYRTLPTWPTLVFAGRLASGLTEGRTADYQMRYLGGKGGVRAGASGDWSGNSRVHGSLELRFPFLERRVYFNHYDVGLGLVLFADGGTIWQDSYRGRSISAGGAGIGIRVFAPFVQVLSFDLAWTPGKGAVFHVSQGQVF